MSRTANTRIKVKRETLIAKLREAIEERKATHAKLLERYDRDRVGLVHSLATEVSALTELIATDPERALKRVENRYSDGVCVRIPKLRLPVEPKLQTGDIERLLRVLEVADDEVVSIAANDDYARFL